MLKRTHYRFIFLACIYLFSTHCLATLTLREKLNHVGPLEESYSNGLTKPESFVFKQGGICVNSVHDFLMDRFRRRRSLYRCYSSDGHANTAWMEGEIEPPKRTKDVNSYFTYYFALNETIKYSAYIPELNQRITNYLHRLLFRSKTLEISFRFGRLFIIICKNRKSLQATRS